MVVYKVPDKIPHLKGPEAPAENLPKLPRSVSRQIDLFGEIHRLQLDLKKHKSHPASPERDAAESVLRLRYDVLKTRVSAGNKKKMKEQKLRRRCDDAEYHAGIADSIVSASCFYPPFAEFCFYRMHIMTPNDLSLPLFQWMQLGICLAVSFLPITIPLAKQKRFQAKEARTKLAKAERKTRMIAPYMDINAAKLNIAGQGLGLIPSPPSPQRQHTRRLILAAFIPSLAS